MAQHDFGDEQLWWSKHGIDPFKLAMEYFKEYSSQADKFAERTARKPKRKSKIPQRKNPWQKRPK
jgi:hypothetical protein